MASGSELTEAGIGAGVVVAALIFIASAFSGNSETESEGYRISMTVANAAGLIEGSDVRLSGISVGEVAALRLLPRSYGAEVVLDIRPEIELSSDTSARILPMGLVGESYVELELGGDDKLLSDGDLITFSQGSVNVIDLVGRFILSATEGREEFR